MVSLINLGKSAWHGTLVIKLLQRWKYFFFSFSAWCRLWNSYLKHGVGLGNRERQLYACRWNWASFYMLGSVTPFLRHCTQATSSATPVLPTYGRSLRSNVRNAENFASAAARKVIYGWAWGPNGEGAGGRGHCWRWNHQKTRQFFGKVSYLQNCRKFGHFLPLFSSQIWIWEHFVSSPFFSPGLGQWCCVWRTLLENKTCIARKVSSHHSLGYICS